VIGDFADLVDEGPEGLDPDAEVLFDCRFHDAFENSDIQEDETERC